MSLVAGARDSDKAPLYMPSPISLPTKASLVLHAAIGGAMAVVSYVRWRYGWLERKETR